MHLGIFFLVLHMHLKPSHIVSKMLICQIEVLLYEIPKIIY